MKTKSSLILSVLLLLIGFGGYIFNIESMKIAFLIITWAGVVMTPFTLFASILYPQHSKTTSNEMWISRFTDLLTIIILFVWNVGVVLPALVMVEIFILEMIWANSNKRRQ